jgi:hypothetical protein
MRKNLRILVFSLLLLLSWGIGASAVQVDKVGTNRAGMAFGPELYGGEELPLEQRYCWMQWNPWIAWPFYFFTGWRPGDGYAIWVNPGVYSQCADPNPYPFLVRGGRIRSQRYTGCTDPATITMRVYLPNNPSDSCAGPDTLTGLVGTQNYEIPTAAHATYILNFSAPVCVNTPFYLAIEYNDPADTLYPSMFVSNAQGVPPTPTVPCANWMRDSFSGNAWMDLQTYFNDPVNFGNLYLRCYGESQSPLCEGSPVFGIRTVASPSETVSVITACAGDVIHIPNISVTSYNGYSGTVKLEWTDLPDAVDSAWFVPATVDVTPSAPGVVTGHIKTKNSLAPGYYYSDIKGTDTLNSAINREAYLWIFVKLNDFSLSWSGTPYEVIAGQSVIVPEKVYALCFNFPVTLSVLGLPAGVTVISITNNGTVPLQTGTNFDINLSADSSTVPGFYKIDITAVGSDPAMTTHQGWFTLWVHPSNYCTMRVDDGSMQWGFSGISQGDAAASYMNPELYCNPLPIKIVDATWWYYYATNRHKLPTTVKAVLWAAAEDSCAGPGDVIGESDPLTKTTAVAGYGVEPVFLTFSNPVCVNGPFFGGIVLDSCAGIGGDSCLGFGTDGQTVQSCQTWFLDDYPAPPTFIWYDGADIIPGFSYGYPLLKLGVQKYSWCICGDVNADGIIDISDIVSVINYVFYSGPAPILNVSDVNKDGNVDISDILILINYIFYNGTEPGC